MKPFLFQWMRLVAGMMWTVVFLCLAGDTNAQYKRRGESLTNPRNSNASSKKVDYTVSQFKGKWQEYERRDRKDSSAVDFKDSIQLNFMDSAKVQTRTSVVTSMSMDGDVTIDPGNILTVAADEYTIKSFKNDVLVLDDDDKFIHVLKKVDSFWYEKLGRIPVKQDDLSKPVNAKINNVLGNWAVYRRKADPGAISDNTPLIRFLNIPSKLNETTATGSVTFSVGQNSQQVNCTVALNGTQIEITAGSNSWVFSVYQADGKNLVFGTAELMYFSKSGN